MPPRKGNNPEEFEKWLKESSISELENQLFEMCTYQLKVVTTGKGDNKQDQITRVIRRLYELAGF